MQNPVTIRFIECFRLALDEKKVRSARQFALSLDYYAQSFNEILKGRREVTMDLVQKAVDIYQFNPLYLFTGQSSKIQEKDSNAGEEISKGLKDIEYISWVKRQEYIKQLTSEEDSFSFPLISVPVSSYENHELKAFEYRGQSLNPCLEDGDIVIARRIPKSSWCNSIKEGFIYVFVTSADLMIARTIDWILEKKELLLSSSSPDQEFGELRNLDELKEVWELRFRLTSKVPSPSSKQYRTDQKLSDFATLLQSQNETIHSLNLTLEKLLKKDRSMRV